MLPTLRKGPDGRPRADFNRCRDRMCLMCGTLRSRACCRRVERCTEKADSLRLATLTLADDGKSLSERLDRLYAAFRSLRKTDVWKTCVRGSIAVVESTMGRSVRHWHVHLHVLFDGQFLPHAQLKKAWHECTGDSYIVHLKAIHGRKSAVHYIAAYVGKPAEINRLTEEEIREYTTAMHGRRLLSTAGNFHNPKEDDDDEQDVPPPSTHIASITAIHHAEHNGSEHVRHACDVLGRLSPKLAMVLDRSPENTASTLPLPDQREIDFAIAVLEHVESRWPQPVEPELCEKYRRHFFSLPEPPKAPRHRQTQWQDQAGW